MPLDSFSPEIDPLTGLPKSAAMPGSSGAESPFASPSVDLSAAPAGPATPAPQAPMNPMVRDYLAKKFNLGNYTDENRNKLSEDSQVGLGDKLAAMAAAVGAGFQGKDSASAGGAVLKRAEDQRNQKLNEFDRGRENTIQNYQLDKEVTTDAQNAEKLSRENDPNSAESKMAQELAVSMGMSEEQAKGLSASKFKDFSPIMAKRYDIAEKAKDREERSADRKEARDLRSSDRNTKLNDDLVSKMAKDLDPNMARGGNLARNQAQVDQAERLKGLYTESNGDIRNLDARQMEELAIGMNKMLSGSSSGSVTQVQALLPHSVVGDSQKLKEWLVNDPQGANQIEFVKRMAETVAREKEIAQNQVRAAQVQRLSAYDKLKKTDPERYQQVLNGYGIDPNDIDEKGQYKPATKRTAPQGPGAAPGNQKQIAKKQYSKSANKTKLVYSDGSEEIVDGRQ